MEIPALGHFLNRKQEKRLLASVRSELDRAGSDTLTLQQGDAVVKAARSGDGTMLRLEIKRSDGADLHFCQHHFERGSTRYCSTHDRRGWGGSSSGSDLAPWRPWTSWLLGRRVESTPCAELPFQPALKAMAEGQLELGQAVVAQAWTAWRQHGQSPELSDGRYRMRASQTEDGASFQAEIVELESGQRWQLAQDVFSDGTSLYASAGGRSLHSKDLFQPLAPEDIVALRHLLGSENATLTRMALERVRAGLAPGEKLEQAAECYAPLAQKPWADGLVDACDRVDELRKRGVDRSTAVSVLLCAGKPEELERLQGRLDSSEACREYVRDPVRWEALRLGESVHPAGSAVRESESAVQVGTVSLRKREG